MSRSKAITFKGTPLTLAGNEVKDGQAAPDFKLNYFEGGMKEITLADVKGKPTIISVVPSLDTAVCAMQTKKFNDQLSIGAGPTINWSRAFFSNGIITPGDEFKFKGTGVSFGFVAGLMYQPTPKHSFGIGYHRRPHHRIWRERESRRN